MDAEKIKRAVRMLIEALGYDPNDEHLRDTPERVVRIWEEFMTIKEIDIISPTWIAQSELVVAKNIEFFSFCPHHLLPWYGTVGIAYIPNGKVVGLSKLARTAKKVLANLIIQENATELIADEIMKITGSSDVMVVIKARHLCMMMRGIKTKADIITVATRGMFKKDKDLKRDTLQLLIQA